MSSRDSGSQCETTTYGSDALAAAIASGERIRVFVPSSDCDGQVVPMRLYAVSIATLLARIAGGATVLPGIGFWANPDGLMVREHVRVVESYLPSDLGLEGRRRLLDACAWLAVEARQVCIAVSIDHGRLYFVSAPLGAVQNEEHK